MNEEKACPYADLKKEVDALKSMLNYTAVTMVVVMTNLYCEGLLDLKDVRKEALALRGKGMDILENEFQEVLKK